MAKILLALILFGMASYTVVAANNTAVLEKQHVQNEMLDEIERRTFLYLWETADPVTGLVPDRVPSPSAASIAAVGFALSAYRVGVERGYVSRSAAKERVLNTLRFFRNAPQGDAPSGTSGHKGFFYHFLDLRTGLRSEDSELSTIDTALFISGMLFSSAYFDGSDDIEAEIRRLAEEIYRRVDWTFAVVRPPAIAHGWTPEQGFLLYEWKGYNEAMILYILALASPTHPVEEGAWIARQEGYTHRLATLFGEKFLAFGPLFAHQYSHIWIDFRGIKDEFMSKAGFDYFENSRRAAHTHRNYSVENPKRWKGYGENIWGIPASDGPRNFERMHEGEKRRFMGYHERGVGVDIIDDGTISPSAAVSSMPFASEIALAATLEMYEKYGKYVFGTYGFFDAFNQSLDLSEKIMHGRIIPGFGWIITDYVFIDQGPILLMIENYRSDLLWKKMRTNEHIRRGLERAGFTGGWLEPYE